MRLVKKKRCRSVKVWVTDLCVAVQQKLENAKDVGDKRNERHLKYVINVTFFPKMD